MTSFDNLVGVNVRFWAKLLDMIAVLNPGLQLSDAQFAAWYDLQKFKRRM